MRERCVPSGNWLSTVVTASRTSAEALFMSWPLAKRIVTWLTLSKQFASIVSTPLIFATADSTGLVMLLSMS